MLRSAAANEARLGGGGKHGKVRDSAHAEASSTAAGDVTATGAEARGGEASAGGGGEAGRAAMTTTDVTARQAEALKPRVG